MSDTKPLTILDFLPLSDRQVIQSVLADALICDYGIVKKVTGNKVVDVEHAVRRVLMGGIQAEPVVQDARISYGIELLFPSAASFAQSWTVAVGDGVLLLGLQNVLPTTQGLTESKKPPEFWHYSSQTLKAIPLSAVRSDALVQFGELNGKAFLRNQAASLYTILNTLVTDLTTFGTGLNVGTLSAQAAALVAALASVTSSLAALLEP